MMRKENKRMQDQVETVLDIATRTLNNPYGVMNVHEVVEEAINHVALIVQNRAGMIYKHLDASHTFIKGNKTT